MSWCGFKVGQQNRSGAKIAAPSDCLGLSPFNSIRIPRKMLPLLASFVLVLSWGIRSRAALSADRLHQRLNACVFSDAIVVSHCAGRFGVGRRGLRCRLGADTEVSREPKGSGGTGKVVAGA